MIVADRFYPSSQLCSNCQNKQKMPLSKRVYECENCSLKIDSDLNASIHMELYPTTDSLSESKACEESNQLNGESIKDSPEAGSERPSHEEWGFTLMSKFEQVS